MILSGLNAHISLPPTKKSTEHGLKWKNSILTYIQQMRAKLTPVFRYFLVTIAPIATIGVATCINVEIPQSLNLVCLASISMPPAI